MEIVRTALYIRVSTEEQALHGLSLEAQQDALEQYARKHEYKIIGTYIDGGKTARKSLKNRTELLRLLEDVKSDKVDLIIFTKLDRWFRNIKDYYKVQDVLEEHHCNWKTIFENYDTGTANGRLHINIMLSIAQDEADRTSERIKAVFANKIERGEAISGKMPLGYKIVNRKIEIDEDTKQIAIDAFDCFYLHQNINQTAVAISTTYGIVMDHGRLKYMLHNPIYKGSYQGHSGFCAPLISAEMFDKVQEILASRNVKRTPSGYEFIFTGMVICAECGCRMIGNAQKRNNRFYAAYRCNKHWNLGGCTHRKVISEKNIETFLLENIRAEIGKYLTELEVEQKQTQKPKTDKAAIKRKLERLKELFINDLIDMESYKKDYTALTEQLQQVDPPEPKQNIVPLKDFLNSDFETVYPSMNNESKRIMWRGIIAKIVVDNGNNISMIFCA